MDSKSWLLENTDRMEAAGFLNPSFLGEGANSIVYRATKDGVPVAIKILHAEIYNTPDRFELFHREVASIACLSHPSIVEVYESGQIGQQLYLVTEFIDGDVLENAVSQSKMDEAACLK
ncbi:MAG: protein kinase domain-containing protein, partial [Pseudobdellovibrionaceae bacterium]